MERKNIRIRRDEVLRIKFLKTEYKKIILKSVARNSGINNLSRFYARTKLQKKHIFLSRWKNFCIITGRARGTTKIFNLSRHMLNKISQQGYTTGFSRNKPN